MQDLYIIKLLLQNTDKPRGIEWQREEPGMHTADFNDGKEGVRVAIGSFQSRTALLTVVRLTSPGLGEVSIQEPLQSVFSFRRKYDSAYEKELAEAMRHLLALVMNQHAQRELNDMENEEERKQAIFHKFLGML